MTEGRVHRVALETPEGTRVFDCGEDERIWDVAAMHGVALPAICHQGRCLTCAGRLLEGRVGGEVEHDHPDAYFAEDEAAGYVLLCCAMPRSEVLIRTHQEWEMREHRLAHGLPAPYA
ncbi:MAG TPA: 2Fe-2S iron-sulfur cluster-binding protein [Edaphobacter sp.]|nr:2Fe-2S iron-sulfur cluster-binding protein [Edaphobacter sp.]